MPPRPTGRGSERLAPETGNVHCGVEITIMDRTTCAADPLPDPKTFSTLWAAEACALATGLGCVALAHLCEGNPCVIAFVSDKVAQHRPGHVEGGFALPRRDLPLGRDIADKDRAAGIDDGAGELVQGILAAVGDLGVQGLHLPLAAAPLRLSKPGFNIAIEARLLETDLSPFQRTLS